MSHSSRATLVHEVSLIVFSRTLPLLPTILVRVNRFFVMLVLTAALVFSAPPQQETPPQSRKSAAANDIFSGTVAELTSDTVTVVRSGAASGDGSRKFALDSQTRVEGRLRAGARVTVRYHAGEDGELKALHIIVR